MNDTLSNLATRSASPAPESFLESYNALRAEQALGRPPRPPIRDGMLPLSVIRFADRCLQPRSFEGGLADSSGHVEALKDAIRSTPGHLLEPVVVWWSGACWRVVDGHHRMIAYQQVREARRHPVKIERVPVVEFRGTLNDAIAEATKRNSRDKLPMTKADKLNRAWRLVTLEDPAWSKRKISEAAGVAERTVANMRVKLDELKADGVDPLEMSWEEAKRGEREYNEDWVEKQARVWAKRLAREFGKKLAQNPTLAALTIETYSKKLPERLVEEWAHLARELVENGDFEDDDF